MKRLEKGPDIFEYTRRPVGKPAQLTTSHRIDPLASRPSSLRVIVSTLRQYAANLKDLDYLFSYLIIWLFRKLTGRTDL
jgi:hypothetical protein